MSDPLSIGCPVGDRTWSGLAPPLGVEGSAPSISFLVLFLSPVNYSRHQRRKYVESSHVGKAKVDTPSCPEAGE